nr:Hpt domain-containing protein [uncultured Sulfurimonas sp.]
MPILRADYSKITQEEMAEKIGLKLKHMPALLSSFIKEIRLVLQELEKAVENKDFASIRKYAHLIKGSAGNLRFDEVYEMSRELELEATQENSEFEFKAYVQAIKEALKSISNQ